MKSLLAALLLLIASAVGAAPNEFVPRAESVTGAVYAIVGPLGQRSADNDGLNATFGFIEADTGVILIDSGASRLGAIKLAEAIRAVTTKPVRWVINTGSQDHRWLGNDYFARQGAEIIALRRTAATQAQLGGQQLASLERMLGKRLQGTVALPATTALDGDSVSIRRGGVSLTLRYTDAHFPGDAMVMMDDGKLVFAGDLVFVDRLLGVLPTSSVARAQNAFRVLAAAQPARIVPGHGRVCDLATAQRDTGDYYDFLANVIGAAAEDMASMDDTLAQHADLPAFRHLQNYDSLHRANMNRAFTEFESQ